MDGRERLRVAVPRGFLLTLTLGFLGLLLLGNPTRAAASVTCPNPIPVVNENNCEGAGTTAWRLTNYSPEVAGYATRTSVNLGQDVTLRVGRANPPLPPTFVDLAVYRMGYYGGMGGRLILSANHVEVDNLLNCNPTDPTTGKLDCTNWSDTYTIPGSALPASGVYMVKITTTDTGEQNHIVFTVRDDSRASKVLFKVPITDWEAYNYFGGKSLYTMNSSGDNTVAGTPRAVKVSFDRPFVNSGNMGDWFLKADYGMVYWLEREGYDVDYTDGPSIDANPSQLLSHKTVVVGAHDEYWSGTEFQACITARNSGVNVYSFGANNVYWKIRYEDDHRTVVDYKTVEGTGSTGSGAAGVNDWGPDGILGTADDALGADGIAGTSDDHPENATTTFRDNGAANGDPNAPAGGRVGPDSPESSLWGAMYFGQNDAFSYDMTIPAGNASGDFAADRLWRNTGVSSALGTTLSGSRYGGWEWDAIPSQAQYLGHEPAGVKRLTGTASLPAPNPPDFLQDEGRVMSSAPPAGQGNDFGSVKYTAPSGALVFDAGMNQFEWGIGPHFIDRAGFDTYEDPPADTSDPRMQQFAYNLFADGGVQPNTPDGITLDAGSDLPPTASFTATPNPVVTGATVTFDASASSDSDGSILRYEWDLDGNGTYETATTTPAVTSSYATAGSYTVGLKVADNGGATDFTTRTLVVGAANQPPTAAFTPSPSSPTAGQAVTFDASSSSDSDGSIVRYEWDLDGNGTYETNTGTNPSSGETFTATGTYTVGLRVTDNGGATTTITHQLVVQPPNTPPVASFTASPSPAVAGQPVTFDASASHDPDGSIVKYEWDLDGNGSFETGTTAPTTTTTYAQPGTRDVSLRVTDNGGAIATIDKPITVGSSSSGTYASTVMATPGLLAYFRLGETGGTTLVDSAGTNPGSLSGGAALGVPGAIAGDSNTAAHFDGVNGTGTIGLNLSSTQKVTVEFWLKWSSYANDDRLAMEFTPNFNNYDGGFIVDPNDASGKFAVGIGHGGGRNNVFFARPSAGVWHQYALVMDSTAPPATQIVPYVDGQPVVYTKLDSGTTAGAFANSNLYLMSRGGNALFGAGDMDELSVYNGTLSATQISDHYTAGTSNQPPHAALSVSPEPASPGDPVTFDASGSSDPDGSIAKYEWDLDGDGTYESTTTSPTTTKTYSSDQTVNVHVRVTDSGGATDVASHSLVVQTPPTAAFTVTPSLATTGQSVSFDASGSHAAGSASVAQYEWDFDGDGTYDLTTSSPTATHTFSSAGDYDVKLRVTDSNGAKRTVTHTLTVNSGSSTVTAALTAQPNPALTGQTVTYDASGSTDLGGTITDYKWDLDGDGTFETDTGTTPTATKTYSSAGQVPVMVRVTDDNGSHDMATRTVTVNSPPHAAFTAGPNPVPLGGTASFDASGSTAPSGTITDYRWDLDGDGTYETDTGTTPTTTHAYTNLGSVNVGLKVTDSNGNTDTVTHPVSVGGSYSSAVLGTSGLLSYWRLGESSGTTLHDAKGSNNATLHGATLGVPGAIAGDGDTAVRFNGSSSDWASAPLDLSATQRVTVEFWLKWNSYANDDELALEFTPNFNSYDGGFIVDPNDAVGTFAVGLGKGAGRNNVFFTRPSAGAWHLYTFVLDTTASGADQITPYVDGQAVSFTKQASGTSAGNFAASTLYFMSRGGNSLFGAGSLDDLAIYDMALPPSVIADHYNRGVNG